MSVNDKQVGGSHYRSNCSHWDYCIEANVPYLEGCASKYLVRWRKKNGLQDLEKAQHYMEKRLDSIMHYRGCVRGARKSKALFNQFLKDNEIPTEEAAIIDLVMHWKSVVEVSEAIDRIKKLIADASEEGAPTSAYVNQDR